MKKHIARVLKTAALTAGLSPIAAQADQWQKLVCQSVEINNYIIYFGPTIRLTLNMTQKVAWDDKGGRSTFADTGTRLGWTRDGVIFGNDVSWNFELDRTTLLLNVSSWAGVDYQCQKDQPRL